MAFAEISAARHSRRSRNPFHAGHDFRGFTGSHICYGLPGCSPPCTDLTGSLQPSGAFTSRLSTGRSPFPLLDITTTVTGLLCWRDFHPQEWQLASLHENRIKECQADLFAGRTSAATMRANQLRLWFAAFAYVVMAALRRIGLHRHRLVARDVRHHPAEAVEDRRVDHHKCAPREGGVRIIVPISGDLRHRPPSAPKCRGLSRVHRPI